MNTPITSTSFVYQARTQFNINFDHKFPLRNYELYVIKILPLETYFEYEYNYINFMIYISFFLLTKIDGQTYLKLHVCLVNRTGGSSKDWSHITLRLTSVTKLN
jgi:hypothetical protein